MKKLIFTFVATIFLLIGGCSDDSGSGTTDPFGTGGGGGTGGVTFTISHRQGDQGGIMFTVRPSTAVTVTQYTCSLPAQQFSETYEGDGTTVYPGNQVYDIAEFTGVASGQQWTFNIKGKIGSATGQNYDVNTNYTVP
jgi:hypothetical protein